MVKEVIRIDFDLATPVVESSRIKAIEQGITFGWTKGMVRGFILTQTTDYWSILGEVFKKSHEEAIIAALGPEEISEATLVCLCCNVL